MADSNQPPHPPRAADRPRRRDVFITAALGLSVLTLLAATGALPLGAYLAAAAAFAALALVYLATAITRAQAPADAPASVAPEAVAQSGDTAERMLERIGLPVLLIGPGGRIERANPAARAFLGLGAEGGLLSTVLRQPSVLEAVSQALRGDPGSRVVYSTLAPHESHVAARVEPIRLEGAEPMPWRAMVVLSDETATKRAERMRADFLANASHELRTPLASLSGFIDTLTGPARDDDEARDRFLDIMRDQTERMRRLIDDLLSLSRVEMNEHLLPAGEVELNGIIRDVVDSLGPVAESRGVALTDAPHPEPVWVGGDRDQIYQVVENLAQNGLKYCKPGGTVCVCAFGGLSRDASEHMRSRISEESGRLTIAAPALDPKARYGVVRVRDDGEGIDRRYLPRLSERFFRVDGQKSGPQAGTGLGLAIVKHIVARHRGGFTVESAPGEGSVFSVFFPVAEAPGSENQSAAE